MKNKMQVVPLSRNPRDKYIHVCVCVFVFLSLLFISFHFLFVVFIPFMSFQFFSFLFITFHVFSFLFMSVHFLHFPSLEKTITNPDHLHVDPFSFADRAIGESTTELPFCPGRGVSSPRHSARVSPGLLPWAQRRTGANKATTHWTTTAAAVDWMWTAGKCQWAQDSGCMLSEFLNNLKESQRG